MIPIQELRIGNWIKKAKSGENYQLKTGADIDTYSTESLPVPIDPEVLRKCGFAYHDYFKLWQKNKLVAGTGSEIELDRDFWMVDFYRRRIGVELKGLHQLQNLYFSLKGKELEMRD